MRMDLQQDGDVVVVTPREDRLDACTASDFKSRLIDCIEAGDRRFVVDLGSVSFVDSSGLGALVAVMKRLGLDGDLVLCGAGEGVLRMLRTSRMDRIFAIVPARDEALSSLRD